MSDFKQIRQAVKATVISGLICAIFSAIGCGSLPWSKKKDNIYSPKPAYQRLDKKAKKSQGKLSESVPDFLSSERPSW